MEAGVGEDLTDLGDLQKVTVEDFFRNCGGGVCEYDVKSISKDAFEFGEARIVCYQLKTVCWCHGIITI